MAADHNKMIDVEPSIAACFMASNNLSSKCPLASIARSVVKLVLFIVAASKGSSAMLLKSKNSRRRSKAEIMAAKQDEISRLQAEQDHIAEIQRLKEKLELATQQSV